MYECTQLTMQSPCFIINASESFLGLQTQLHSLSSRKLYPRCVSCNLSTQPNRSPSFDTRVNAKGKAKDNVWSVDNEAAAMGGGGRRERGGGKRVRRQRKKRLTKRREDGKVMVSGAMLMEVETVLQIQEPVIRPVWNTFASSVSGIWKGVGAVFSPITAEMDPIDLGKKNEHLFDCFTLSHIEVVPSANGGQRSKIQRKISWVTMNPYGENKQLNERGNRSKQKSTHEYASLSTNEALGRNHTLPKFESFDFEKADIMEEDVMGMEPGLVFFEVGSAQLLRSITEIDIVGIKIIRSRQLEPTEQIRTSILCGSREEDQIYVDGSYSRGPVAIPVDEVDDSNYYLTPTIKFEQCLVKGCHKRLRIVHTIEFNDGGSDIQIMRVAVYEEQWVSTANLPDQSDVEFDSKPLSERKRVQPSELTGSWKVFEMSATPIYDDDTMAEESNDTPYLYLCTETLKKRSLPDDGYFREEEALDMADATVMWLPGGVTGYVDVKKDGILCIGVGWYSDEGINLVMERDYGIDGKLKDVRYLSELKRRWSEPLPS